MEWFEFIATLLGWNKKQPEEPVKMESKPMVGVSKEQFIMIMPNCRKFIDKLHEPLNSMFQRYEINTVPRQACAIGQMAVETGQLQWQRELWGPTTAQQRYERDFNSTWPETRRGQRNYVATMLGNSERGDGARFMGRGLIQLTGRDNYRLYGEYCGVDFVSNPQKVEELEHITGVFGWYWHVRKNLNPLADVLNIVGITHKINGGENHLKERIAFTDKALEVLS